MDDAVSITLGATTVGLLVKEAIAFWRERHQKTEIAPQPLEVKGAPDYVTREEFRKHADDNARDHENMFSRLNRNDRETSEMSGTLKAIREDVTLIKNKLFKTTRT